MKNRPTKNADRVLRIWIYSGYFTLPSAIACKLAIIVFTVVMDGPNLSIFLPIPAAPPKELTFADFLLISSLSDIIVSYCYSYRVRRNLQKY